MRYIKTYELFDKKQKGNYLTKRDQDKGSFNEYLYNNGFSDRYYVCSKCFSYQLTPIPQGGMTPPKWKCDNCDEINYAPQYMSPEDYKDFIEDKELKKAISKYNI